MTLALAIVARDGIVFASDSQMTFSTSGQPVRTPTVKLYLPWSNVAWSAAGNVGIIQRVEQELGRKHARPDTFAGRKAIVDVRRELAQCVAQTVRGIVRDQYQQAPNLPGWESTFLFAGYAMHGQVAEPFLVGVEPNGIEADHTPVGYCAIGSGDIFAYAGLTHFEVRRRSLHEAKLIAHRVMRDAIQVAAFGLGPPVQMIEISAPDGATPAKATRLTPEDVRVLSDKVDEWKLAEGEVLTELVGAPATAEVPVGDPEQPSEGEDGPKKAKR